MTRNPSKPGIGPPKFFSDLTKNQQGLLRKFQQVGYGSIGNIHFENGEPMNRPAPRIRRQIKLKCYGKQKPPDPPDDFELKDEHIQFFNFLRDEGSGYISQIKLTDGLPAEMSVEDVA